MGLPAGIGLGWRPETAWRIAKDLLHMGEARVATNRIAFVEVLAENLDAKKLPAALVQLVDAGVPIVVHGVSLSLAGAELPCRRRLDRLAQLAIALRSNLVSEHIAFVRSDTREAHHLLPIERSRENLAIVCENVRFAQRHLPVPLALENIASVWNRASSCVEEWTFLDTVQRETGSALLLDLANLFADAHNYGVDAQTILSSIRREQIAYIHVAGGRFENGFYFDTHRHELAKGCLDMLVALQERLGTLPVLLERDGNFDASVDSDLETLHSLPQHAALPHGRRRNYDLQERPAEADRTRLREEQRKLVESVLTSNNVANLSEIELERARHIVTGKQNASSSSKARWLAKVKRTRLRGSGGDWIPAFAGMTKWWNSQ